MATSKMEKGLGLIKEPVMKKINDACEQSKKDQASFAARIKEAKETFRELEGFYRGKPTDDEPEEFLRALHQFVQTFQRVKEEIELKQIKSERDAQKRDKQKSALLAEIEKGVSLKRTNERKLPPKQQQENTLESELASASLFTTKLQKAKGSKMRRQERPTKQAPSTLDMLLSQIQTPRMMKK
eukprot:TRINITY_DN1462_c0_g2_i3.p1 TRINITY_DN1462_c0_g2~~TRINITY_DN1462_c0_g2_i3.p1  ORF type:complete len:184 (-),score=64.98 TRINITY_DN1462_c0_g2_i3:223-774(-)